MPPEHEITDLRRVGRRARLEVYVDGARAWEMGRKLAKHLKLAVGQRLSPEELATLRQTVARQETKAAALRMLGRRARSTADLRQRLVARGHEESAVGETLTWLTERGFLNDEQYAQDRVTALVRRRLGSRSIELKLRQEGVPGELVREVLQQRAQRLHEPELARELAAQLSERWRTKDWPSRRDRIYQHLMRRGFEQEDIRNALMQIEPGEGSSEED